MRLRNTRVMMMYMASMKAPLSPSRPRRCSRSQIPDRYHQDAAHTHDGPRCRIPRPFLKEKEGEDRYEYRMAVDEDGGARHGGVLHPR